jgi:flagellar biosynthesis anti-sigma factor FlgM
MKVENNGLTPLSSQKADGLQPAANHRASQAENHNSVRGRDQAQVSEHARMLAKARTALENVEDVENKRLEVLQQQIQSGNYEIPVEELARRLLPKIRGVE